jgi:hypothetical protein
MYCLFVLYLLPNQRANCQISEKYTIWGQTFARNYVLSAHYIALIRGFFFQKISMKTRSVA